MLVIFSGLPGTGKSTIAMALAIKRSVTYVRVDEIEHPLSRDGILSDGRTADYLAGFAVASSNLRLGNHVIADSVNPVPESRQGWREVAIGAATPFLEIEVVCSDERA